MRAGKTIIVCALALTPLLATAQRYVVSTDGSEVTDQKTGLVWRRCVEGMALSSGTCTGTARTFDTHKEALQEATTQASSSGIVWRLPNIRELLSITDATHSNPTIDSTVFPSTPSNWFWSASTYDDDPSVAKDSGDANTQRRVDEAVVMNKSFGNDVTVYPLIWVVGFNGNGYYGVRSADNTYHIDNGGYVRLVRSANVSVGPSNSLIDAATRGDADTVQALITRGADVNAKDNDGVSALLWASWKGNFQVVQLLLANGADVNAKSKEGMTALIAASGQGFIEVVQALLSNGADVNAKGTSGPSAGATALINASFNDDPGVVQALLAKGADINAQSNNGTTPLIAASVNGCIGVVKVLIAKGADVNAKSSNGLTALYAATAKGHTDVRALLIQAGAKQ